MTVRQVKIGLAGLGTVGGGVVSILNRHAADFEQRLGARISVKRIAVRDPDRRRSVEVDRSVLTANYLDLAADPEIDVIVELMGGIDHPFKLICEAMERGKHVVTANKALLAAKGNEIFRLAAARGVDVYYEAAVCGGIPIIRTLREALVSDRITALYGIINGTTNFILSAMSEQGGRFDDTLSQAQKLGYAEADPTLDVSGGDAAQKLCVLAQLAFGARLKPEEVLTEGILGLGPEDIAVGRDFGYELKLLAVARRCGASDRNHKDRIEARVHPTFIPRESLLAGVRGAYNAVAVESDALGRSLLYGQGAGAMPTGSAVVSDIIDLSRNILASSPGRVALPPVEPRVEILPHAEVRSGYLLRFAVRDEPGVLARIATALGARQISIAAARQREREGTLQHPEGGATVVFVTHQACEGDVREVIREVDGYSTTLQPTRLIRIEQV